MAYRLEPGEPVAEGLKRIVREELDAALACIATSTDEERDTAVHEARKSIKKIRALLRLARPVLGAAYRHEKDRLRPLARRLSDMRDSAAMLETVSSFTENSQALSEMRKALLANHKPAAAEDALERTASGFKKMKRRADAWSLKNVKLATLEAGLGKSHHRGRRLMKLAARHSEPAIWHELRKRVKDYWYDLRLLETVSPEASKAPAKQISRLETALGDDHNLVVLTSLLTRNPARFGGEAAVTRALELIGKRQRKLRSQSLTLGSKLYGVKTDGAD